MTAEQLFLSCSVNQPLPPPVRGADRLSRHLRDPEARPARSSPYALPGLRKVMVFGPRRQDERYRGEWQNTGVVHTGSSKEVAQKRPTAKDLPPRPLPPLNVSVASVQQGTPPQPLHSHNDGSRLEPPQQEAQLPPQAVPAERVEEVCVLARSRMRRQVLSVNGMPSNDENIAMARTALADAIAHTPNMPAGQHYLPDADTFITSLTKITGTVRTVVKSAAHAIISHKYNLELDIWDASSEVAHKLRVVPALTTHLQCLFTTVNMILDGILQSVAVLEHEGLVSLVIKILWTHGFYKDLDFNDPTALDGVIALAGAALCSALMEYKTGVYKRVEFSTVKSKDTYQNVTTYISDKIYPRVELAARFGALKDKMKERGEVRLGL
ncbi:hypothetical protein CY34DRAFT_110608 [Suillus luteus UH-Slu-Lm8-n1]|uniref:DUF6532 domain-containing protein n=1 Tax=Suillus luteus UH-Slu-Lm8-n1 TaxID=930992 RepID=A0A0C9Z7P0_9AGAM|nr:hypothetical protein CY34DRAFT_110608 [Suillus luteus UH-Slu-Lm8-n1]